MLTRCDIYHFFPIAPRFTSDKQLPIALLLAPKINELSVEVPSRVKVGCIIWLVFERRSLLGNFYLISYLLKFLDGQKLDVLFDCFFERRSLLENFYLISNALGSEGSYSVVHYAMAMGKCQNPPTIMLNNTDAVMFYLT